MADLTLFWSYAHSDDVSDRGRVTLLANHLADEIRVVSGLELDLFLDREGITWGDQWRARIDAALASSTFLVSVLTPTYFKRVECRKEFVDFYSQAESRGLHKLLLPLAYADVPGFGSDNPDEVIAIASRYQYEDWTLLRLKDPSSEEYRRGVNGLAVTLLELHRTMAEKEREKLVHVASHPSPDKVEFLDALAEIDKRLPAWTDAVEDHIVQRAQSLAIDRTYEQRFEKAPQARHLAIRHRYASDELRVIAPTMELARQYSSLTIDMAPFVTAAVRAALDNDEAKASLKLLAEAVGEAHEAINLHIDGTPAHEYWREWAGLGGIFKDLFVAHLEFMTYIDEANGIVEGWHGELSTLFD